MKLLIVLLCATAFGKESVRNDEFCPICTESILQDSSKNNEFSGATFPVFLVNEDGRRVCSGTHIFHNACIQEWIKHEGRASNCPLCRKPAMRALRVPHPSLDKLMFFNFADFDGDGKLTLKEISDVLTPFLKSTNPDAKESGPYGTPRNDLPLKESFEHWLEHNITQFADDGVTFPLFKRVIDQILAMFVLQDDAFQGYEPIHIPFLDEQLSQTDERIEKLSQFVFQRLDNGNVRIIGYRANAIEVRPKSVAVTAGAISANFIVDALLSLLAYATMDYFWVPVIVMFAIQFFVFVYSIFTHETIDWKRARGAELLRIFKASLWTSLRSAGIFGSGAAVGAILPEALDSRPGYTIEERIYDDGWFRPRYTRRVRYYRRPSLLPDFGSYTTAFLFYFGYGFGVVFRILAREAAKKKLEEKKKCKNENKKKDD